MNKVTTACAVVVAACAFTAHADTRPDTHAPITVMGDHTHRKGEVMLSYRYMRMAMDGNRDGRSSISPEAIVTSAANRFANPPMMPPNLRVVPTRMTMDMHMIGAMYAPSDSITLMGMTSYNRKEMDHLTFAGPSGTDLLGEFTTRSSGFGDTSLSALIRLPGLEGGHWHATLGISLPTGDINETDDVLAPMNTEPTVRLPYPMQLGSGTYDLIGGLTYSANHGPWGWGAQWRSVVRLGENSADYALGDEHRIQGWASYRAHPGVSLSARLGYFDRGNIAGIDPNIIAPVQTADPDRQGAERLDLAAGANVVLPGHRHRLALEFIVPVAQNLNGPQLEMDYSVTLGWQLAL